MRNSQSKEITVLYAETTPKVTTEDIENMIKDMRSIKHIIQIQEEPKHVRFFVQKKISKSEQTWIRQYLKGFLTAKNIAFIDI